MPDKNDDDGGLGSLTPKQQKWAVPVLFDLIYEQEKRLRMLEGHVNWSVTKRGYWEIYLGRLNERM